MTTQQPFKPNLRGHSNHDMNFNLLLRAYREGGTKDQPIERTMATIVDYLMNKKQYPADVIGGALFLVFNWLAMGHKFHGDGTYGSRGRELVTAIRLKCDELLHEKIEAETYKAFVEAYSDKLFELVEVKIDDKIPLRERRFINWWYGRKIYNVPS